MPGAKGWGWGAGAVRQPNKGLYRKNDAVLELTALILLSTFKCSFAEL